jgi:hypothetical protein
MSRRRPFAGSFVAVVAVAVVGMAGPALAGPPLLCHPFSIGDAASLPWDGSRAFWQGRADYHVANVVSDTDTLMTRSMPVVVRMETLRRAAIYASADAGIASRLYARFAERLRQSETAGRPDPLALFDFAYLTETYRQIAELDRYMSEFQGRGPALRRLIGSTDGYALMTKVLLQRTDDPAMEFAAALMRGRRDDPAYRAHAEKARAGASRDALVARNLSHIS